MPRPFAIALLLLLAACGGEERIQPDALVFQQQLAEGAWLHVRNGRGSIRVTRAAGDSVSITARRRERGRRPEDVNFMVSRRRDEIIVCAVWGSTGRCDTDHVVGSDRGLGGRLRSLVRGRVAVDFEIAVPAGVRVDARQHTGDIAMDGVESEVVAQAFRGNVSVRTTAGPMRVLAVHGNVSATVAALARDVEGGIVLESREGDIVAEVPATLAADLELRAPKGRVRSDVAGARAGEGERAVSARVGGGGRAMTLDAHKGDVLLRTRS